MEIVTEDPDSASLLTLFMAAALRERAGELDRTAPRGELAIEAGGMAVTLDCSAERIVVREGIGAAPRARLRSSLEALVEIARGRLGGPLASRRARVRGNPLALLPLARAFRAGAS